MNSRRSQDAQLVLANEVLFQEVQHMLNANKQVWIRVKGNSMLPFISDGDKVLLQVFQAQIIPLGSVLLGKFNGSYVLHRYVKKNKNNFILAGDNNLSVLEEIAPAQLIAVAIKHNPKNKKAEIQLDALTNRVLGLLWYYIRYPRRVWAKLTK